VSVWGRIYCARVAPCSDDWREAIYNGVEVVDGGKLMRESWAPNAFIASGKPAPVVLSHDESKPVGHIVNRIVHNGWHIVDFVLDPKHNLACIAADRLRHGWPVSIGARSLRHDKLLAQDGILRHTIARLDELSILAPNELPYYPEAKVTQFTSRKRSRSCAREPSLASLRGMSFSTATARRSANISTPRSRCADTRAPRHLRSLAAHGVT
jgi:hypothetical protein